jgi:guanidinoacetate N-methyltransferase
MKDTKQTRVDLGFKGTEEWGEAPADFTVHTLKILGHPVMEDWETGYMEVLAKTAALNGGTVLEVGYGMGISAKFIHTHNIKKHIIIEANNAVAEKARVFASTAHIETEVFEGFWEDEIDKIQNESIDGMLFDTYPLSEKEIHKNHYKFFPFAYKKLRKGGVFTYYSDEISSFSKEHCSALVEAGFWKNKIHYKKPAYNKK